jgi:hypothetical protein
MNYNIDLPEELKTVSNPKFKIGDDSLAIYNKPFVSDWLFEILILLLIISLARDSHTEYRTDYLIVTIALGLFGLSGFSLNKVLIDFKQKSILVKNFNPLVNLCRKFFKMPFEIPFNNINKFYPDWKIGGHGSSSIYLTILETDVPYRFRIAIFTREDQSIIFTDYLNKLIKHHSIHTVQGSDTTVMP